MLTMLAYAWYAERPSPGRYALVAASFGLGLTAKPMLVTLPFVLLLLDYWPLRRFSLFAENGGPPPERRLATVGRLVLEKVPLFAMTAAACAVTLYAQKKGMAVSSLDTTPIDVRVLNALASYAGYIGKTFWPFNLVPFYPHPGRNVLLDEAGRAGLLLAAVSALVIWGRRRRYLTVGWLWYLGTLVPVIGLVQVGGQAMADRYMYLPQIGLFIFLAWGVADLTAPWPRRVRVLVPVTALLLAFCVGKTAYQVRLWAHSVWLWEYTTSVTENNALAHNNLGSAYVETGQPELAAEQFQLALKANPNHSRAHNNLGIVLLQLGRPDDAITHFADCIRNDPRQAKAYYNWGLALAMKGHFAEAIPRYEEAIRLDPDAAGAYTGLAIALARVEEWPRAVETFRKAVELGPEMRGALTNLAWALCRTGQCEEGTRLYHEARESDPEWVEVARKIAWARATNALPGRRNPEEAVRYGEQACQATEGQDAKSLDTLGAAYASDGRFDDAVRVAREALALAQSAGETGLAEEVGRRISLYEAKQPFREEAPK
jgi:tetratricopeptide (TPR) repeat protein